MLPFDLHVLGLPLAFILSQDQTLHCITLNKINNKKIDKLELSHDCFTIRILIAIAIKIRIVKQS